MPLRDGSERGIHIAPGLALAFFPAHHSCAHNPKLPAELLAGKSEFMPESCDLVRHADRSAKRTPNVKCLLHSPFWHKSAMGTQSTRGRHIPVLAGQVFLAPKELNSIAGRLAWAREHAGFEGPAEAAQALGINRFTYTQHENGSRGFKRHSAIQYARKFKVSLEWLLTGRGEPKSATEMQIPVTHYVGAGAEVYPFDDQGALEYIPALPGLEHCEAAIIRGDSMTPFQDGWIVVWRREVDGVVESDVGKLCLISVKDGPMLVKVLRRAAKKGHWNLESWNAPLRENVPVTWAAAIVDIRPR